MKRCCAIMLSTCLLQAVTLSAFAQARAQNDYRGIWAGERMLCGAPRNRLHVYGPKRIRHPAIYKGDTGYACQVVRIKGQQPVWTFQLNCTTFGNDQNPRRLEAIQTLRMLEGHRRLAVTMKAKHGGIIWSDEFLRCRSLPQR